MKMKTKKAVPALLTSRQVSRALPLPYKGVAVLQPTGILDRTAVCENGGPVKYSTHALAVVALLQDMADAVERGRMTTTEAGHALVSMVPAAIQRWNGILRGGLVEPM